MIPLDSMLIFLSSWNDRIPMVLLVGVATSLDLFQDKLSIATKRRIRAVQFDVVQIDTDSIFKQIVSLDQPNKLWLGPSLSRMILQRQSNTIQDLSFFIRNFKVNFYKQLFI